MRRFSVFLTIVGSIIAVLLWLGTLEIDNIFIERIAGIMRVKSQNLLVNANFKNDLKDWQHTSNVDLVVTNGLRYINIECTDSAQKRIWQEVNVVSGKLYRLSFVLNGPDRGGFAIYRYVKTGIEQYLWCNGKNDCKKYVWDIKSDIYGNIQIYLSSNVKGTYHYSDISFIRLNNDLILVYRLVSFFILLIVIFMLLRFNVLAVICLVILLVIPIFKIDNQDKSLIEKRELAKYKSLFSKSNNNEIKLNINYGIDFNSWLNDHFFLRNCLIKLFNVLKIRLNNYNENSHISSGNNGFYFEKTTINDIIKSKNIEEDEYQKTLLCIKKFNDFCKQNKIDLYILVIPYCAEIYREQLRGIDLSRCAASYSNIVNRLNCDADINILYAYDVLLEGKNEDYVYYKTDHHWSQLGAYKGYELLMKKLKEKYPGLTIVNEDQYAIKHLPLNWKGTLLNKLNYDDNKKTKYLTFDYKYKDNLSNTWMNKEQDLSHVVIYNKKGNNKKVFLFGDSYILNYYSFFTHTFYETFCYYKCLQIYMPFFEKIILDYKPDIVIMNIYAENCKRIKNWYGQKYKVD